MADSKTKDTNDQGGTKDSAPEVDKYPVADLIARSVDFLGVESYVAAGALHTTRLVNISLDDAQAAVKKFLDEPVAKEA